MFSRPAAACTVSGSWVSRRAESSPRRARGRIRPGGSGQAARSKAVTLLPSLRKAGAFEQGHRCPNKICREAPSGAAGSAWV